MNIWITGAGSGIGKELALHYARQGHQVIISGRTAATLNEVAAHADAAGRIHTLPFDVTDTAQVETTTEQMQHLTDHLDVIVLNAGTCEYIKRGRMDIDLFRRVFDTNVFGMINAFNAALPLLQKAPQRPLVAGVCSLASFIGFPRAEAYGASKAAARYLLHSLRTDYHYLLDVTVINPGFITTPMTERNDFPMPFLMSAETAAARIARALQRRPREYNFPTRLVGLLRLTQLFQGLWYKVISNKSGPAAKKEPSH